MDEPVLAKGVFREVPCTELVESAFESCSVLRILKRAFAVVHEAFM